MSQMEGQSKELRRLTQMKVLITLNKTNTGKIQLAYVRSTNERGGIGTGSALPSFNPNAASEVEEILRNIGVEEDLIQRNMTLLRQVGPNELVKVADIEVPDDVLMESGFAAWLTHWNLFSLFNGAKEFYSRTFALLPMARRLLADVV